MVRWSAMWHISISPGWTWCGRKVPPDAETSDHVPSVFTCYLCQKRAGND